MNLDGIPVKGVLESLHSRSKAKNRLKPKLEASGIRLLRGFSTHNWDKPGEVTSTSMRLGFRMV